jgi:hypothetical protein
MSCTANESMKLQLNDYLEGFLKPYAIDTEGMHHFTTYKYTRNAW